MLLPAGFYGFAVNIGAYGKRTEYIIMGPGCCTYYVDIVLQFMQGTIPKEKGKGKGEISMYKNKSNKILRFASFILMFTLVSTCLLSGTLAKYVSSFGGNDSARVAKWDFNATNLGTGTTQTINIFNTAYGTTVQSADGTKIVAPGTTSSFDLQFTGKSEVESKITFGITEENNGTRIPLIYKINGKYYSNYYTAGNHYLRLNETSSSVQTIAIEGNLVSMQTDMNAGITVPVNTLYSSRNTSIEWYWAFEEYNDAAGTTLTTSKDQYDTNLGIASPADTVKLTITATATQVD